METGFSSFNKASAKNFFKKYFECLKKFLLNEQENAIIYDFQQSLLLVVSRACCENCLEKELFERAQQILTSFDTVQIAKIEDKTDAIIYERVLDFFHKIVKTKKFCEALKKLIRTMDVKINNDKITEKIYEVIQQLSKIQPILVKNVTINGMICPKNNFFIKENFIGDLSNIKNSKNLRTFQKLKAAKGSLLRLLIHESAHLVIRFCQSEKNGFDYLLSTPPNNFKKEYSEYVNLECGSRLEAILFGSCERVFYGFDEYNEKVFDQTIWDNENLPIFSKEEENKMDLIKKNVYFSGIDESRLNNYE